MQFVDTNVLLYAISKDESEAGKAVIANRILEGQDLGLSVQVLQEFYVQATRPTRSDSLSHGQALGLVKSFLRFPIQEIDVSVMLAAIATSDRFAISYWDAAIIESARSMGRRVVLSEDLSDGQDYAGVKVENPFTAL